MSAGGRGLAVAAEAVCSAVALLAVVAALPFVVVAIAAVTGRGAVLTWREGRS